MNGFACGLAVALAVALSGAPPTPNRHTVETVMQDDALLLYRPHASVRKSAQQMAELGVDRVRLTASWSGLAPSSKSRTKPEFNASDSRQYPKDAFHRLDTAIREVRRAGMDVMVDIAFFAPRWAVRRPEKVRGRDVWRPKTAEFRKFSRALAERYSGRFDENGQRLPAVRMWTTWNEPNHPVFLMPQWERVKRKWRPASPHIYRALHNAAYQQLNAVNGDNKVLIGGLAAGAEPGKGAGRGIGPLRFTRELACVDSKMKPLQRKECRRFRPLLADGFAMHPYSLDSEPDARDDKLDRVQIGELDKLTWLLGQLQARKRFAAKLPIYLTEYGYETAPHDPVSGRPPWAVGHALGHATYLAWRNPDVRSYPQFLLQDIGPDNSAPIGSKKRFADYQTGLYDDNGKPKPSVVSGFKLPFYVDVVEHPDGFRETLIFGQVRPGKTPQRVTLQRQVRPGAWLTEATLPIVAGPGTEGCGDFATSADGVYQRRALYRPNATYRAVWLPATGGYEVSTPSETPPKPRPVGGPGDFGLPVRTP